MGGAQTPWDGAPPDSSCTPRQFVHSQMARAPPDGTVQLEEGRG